MIGVLFHKWVLHKKYTEATEKAQRPQSILILKNRDTRKVMIYIDFYLKTDLCYRCEYHIRLPNNGLLFFYSKYSANSPLSNQKW